jgi:hypothetical protein
MGVKSNRCTIFRLLFLWRSGWVCSEEWDVLPSTLLPGNRGCSEEHHTPSRPGTEATSGRGIFLVSTPPLVNNEPTAATSCCSILLKLVRTYSFFNSSTIQWTEKGIYLINQSVNWKLIILTSFKMINMKKRSTAQQLHISIYLTMTLLRSKHIPEAIFIKHDKVANCLSTSATRSSAFKTDPAN